MYEPVLLGDLRIETRDDPPRFVFLGKSNAREPLDVLQPFFEKWLAEAVLKKIPLELRFEDLDHMNSGTITALIFLIDAAQARGTVLKLSYAKAKKWQRLSFEALRVFQKHGAPLELLPLD